MKELEGWHLHITFYFVNLSCSSIRDNRRTIFVFDNSSSSSIFTSSLVYTLKNYRLKKNHHITNCFQLISFLLQLKTNWWNQIKYCQTLYMIYLSFHCTKHQIASLLSWEQASPCVSHEELIVSSPLLLKFQVLSAVGTVLVSSGKHILQTRD